jgi:hypothetical protein
MKKGPDKLAADVFQAEFEMRVLVHGVMAAVEGGCADIEALFVGDFVRGDQTRGVASARRGNGRIEGMGKRVAECYARRSGIDRVRDRHAIEHTGLSSHWKKILHGDGGANKK